MGNLPMLKGVVVFEAEKIPDELKNPKFFLWKDFMKMGEKVKDEIVEEKMR